MIRKTKPRILRNTKSYLAGPIEFSKDGGIDFRKEIQEKLKFEGITFFNPNSDVFFNDKDLGKECDIQNKLKKLRERGEYDKLHKLMKKIRGRDLNLVDRSDFLIVFLDLDIVTCGTYEELFSANKMKKVIFVIIKQGKKKAPLWLFGTIPPNYIYSSVNEVVKTIKKINSGEIPIDSDRWRLLNYQYR